MGSHEEDHGTEAKGLTGSESSPGEWDTFAPHEPGRRVRRLGLPEYLAIAIGVLIVIGLVALWPSASAKEQAAADFGILGVPSEFHEAVVISAVVQPCPAIPDVECTAVSFEIVAGPDAGRTYRQDFTSGSTTPEFAVGDVVVVSRIPPSGRIVALRDVPCDFDPETACIEAEVRIYAGTEPGEVGTLLLFPGQEAGLAAGQEVIVTFDIDDEILGVAPATLDAMYRFADFQRRSVLMALFVVFAFAVIALGRWRGVAALAGLGLSLLIVVLWLIPSLLEGNPAVVVAIVGASAVAYLALYVSHGVIVLIAGLSWLTTVLAQFSGLATEEATLLLALGSFDIRGLLLAGIVIGAAGALDDVTVTQASVVTEIRSADPSIDRLALFKRGMAIGRAHVGSIVNTLVLAYLGAAMPLVILFILAQQSLGSVANGEVIAIEIVRSLVGTIGIVAAVPLTTWMAVVWPARNRHH